MTATPPSPPPPQPLSQGLDPALEIVNGFEKGKKNIRVEGGTISLFYFGSSQFCIIILCRISDRGFLLYVNNLCLQGLE